MISEATFSRDFASFWRQTTPAMDGFVRRLNKGEYDRDDPPIDTETAPTRRAFVNESAFSALCLLVENARTEESMSPEDALLRVAPAVASQGLYEFSEGDYDPNLSDTEIWDGVEQIRRIQRRVCGPSDLGNVVVRPKFTGCGIVDECYGDILVHGTLFEIKAGERFFRSIDFRQVLTYVALDYSSGSRKINDIAVVNPRIGISVELSVKNLCFAVSGRETVDLLDLIIYGMSSGDVSR
ncbi:hypothetical protein GCM10017083_50210 [Thalassobaculum fulvum]|uniref:Uncharacterized protein n=1 Tax=Thalassobaculum fulvum TaxID=1633335 RepID=A0A918XWP6_9PROT|nr:hypothetical protein [Thalassobaculum fulvum]GHD62016.1 hypothetical protein GCM10017083_50210 [Thalassobaculum fulvum]